MSYLNASLLKEKREPALLKSEFFCRYNEAYVKKKPYDVLELVSEFWGDSRSTLKHPEAASISTRPRCSGVVASFNFVVFSDSDGQNMWLLGQSTSFVNLLVTESGTYDFGASHELYESASKFLVRGFVEHFVDYSTSFAEGFVLHHTGPFHYFYDQLMWWIKLSDLREDLPTISRNAFLIPESAQPVSGAGDRSILFFPTVLNRNVFLPPSSDKLETGFLDFMSSYLNDSRIFEQWVFRQALGKYSKLDGGIQKRGIWIWIGITGSKRSWVEQVLGYACVVKKLREKVSGPITVFIDGYTAPEGKKANSYVDEVIAKEIAYCLADAKVDVVSLVGEDYIKKIGVASDIDWFIANAGTGCLVPLRFAQRPGVLHSNTKLFTFPDDYSGSNVAILNKSIDVVDILRDGKMHVTMLTSYSISESRVWNALLEVMGEGVMSANNVSREAGPYSFDTFSRELVSSLEGRLANVNLNVSDLLYEVSLLFESSGDMGVAYQLIINSLKLRPDCEMVRVKERAYREALGGKLYSFSDWKGQKNVRESSVETK